jgi:hypothetical protein
MKEIAWADLITVDALTRTISACRFSPESVFLGEENPKHYLTTKQRQDALVCKRYDEQKPSIYYAAYTSGRIFSEEAELRWEQNDALMQVVYIGVALDLPELRPVEDLSLDKYQTKKYFLFGERLSAEQLQRIGDPAQEGDFAELRIPRLLHYPVQFVGNRVQVIVREYVQDAISQSDQVFENGRTAIGAVKLFRFQSLEVVE